MDFDKFLNLLKICLSSWLKLNKMHDASKENDQIYSWNHKYTWLIYLTGRKYFKDILIIVVIIIIIIIYF